MSTPKTRTLIGTLFWLLVVALVLSQAACDTPRIKFYSGNSPTEPQPAPAPTPAPIQVTALGVVEVSGGFIKVGDRSTSVPANSLREIVWTVKTSETGVVSTKSIAPAGTWTFGSFVPGSYIVDQLAVANDGNSAPATYGPFTIP